jgi:hypothetical protein
LLTVFSEFSEEELSMLYGLFKKLYAGVEKLETEATP